MYCLWLLQCAEKILHFECSCFYWHCRVVSPPESFLLVFYSSQRTRPQFFECVTSDGSSQLRFSLCTCHEVMSLPKVSFRLLTVEYEETRSLYIVEYWMIGISLEWEPTSGNGTNFSRRWPKDGHVRGGTAKLQKVLTKIVYRMALRWTFEGILVLRWSPDRRKRHSRKKQFQDSAPRHKWFL